MLKITGLKLPLGFREGDLKRAAAKQLRLPESAIGQVRLCKKSVDARKKDNVHFVCAVEAAIQGDENRLLSRRRDNAVQKAEPYRYQLPQAGKLPQRPVVVGFGPAGMFAALLLAQCGQEPIVLERGQAVEERERAVQRFWKERVLDSQSNVQFGEGGAGTFSDGKLNTLVKEVTENLDAYEIGVASAKVYDFLWDTYCDWYIELTKTRLQGEDEDSKLRAQQVLCYVLTETLKLLHPFMPFITEEIWQALPHSGDYLMLQQWPQHRAELDFPEEEKAMELIMDAIRGVRTRRSEMNVPPSKKAHLTVATGERDIFVLGVPFLKKLAYASEVTFAQPGTAPEAGSVTVVTHAAQISMPLAELVDLEKEKARMEKELKKNSAELEKLNTKLNNPGFVNKAPAHVVEAEQDRAEKLRALLAKLEESAASMA